MKLLQDFRLPKKTKFSLYPDFISETVAATGYAYLRKTGITTCFIDLDGTVVSRGEYIVDKRIKQALERSGLTIYIATNRPKSRDLKTLKEDLGAAGVIHPKGFFGKPTKRYHRNALQGLGLEPNRVVMIGDRYIQDILGANRAGVYSLLVYKLGESKNKADNLISTIEKNATRIIQRRYHDI